MNVPPLPVTAQKKSALAITSLVLGILSIPCCSFITGVPAIICGHIARGKIKRDPSLSGDGLALGGLILGYISLLMLVVGLFSTWPTLKLAVEYGQVGLHVAQVQPLEQAIARLGYPADTGVKTVAELKEQLVKGGISEMEIEAMDLSQFQFGNVSASDPGTTILIRAKDTGSKGVVIFINKSGSIEALPEADAAEHIPQRQPAYLAE